MGVKQKYVKRIAHEIMKLHGDRVTNDFGENRELLKGIVDIQGTLVTNQIAGYMVRLKKRNSR